MNSNENFRILLIGWTGQVGSELLKLLPSHGEVYLAGSAPVDMQAKMLPDVVAKKISGFLQLNLADPSAIPGVMRDVKPSFVINAAAYTAVDKAESDRMNALQINGIAPGVLAVEAKALGAPLIHYSTDYVFDGSGDTPKMESDATGPLNYYGETKLVGEKAITGTDGPHLIFRTSWVVSCWGSNFIKTMLKYGAERQEMKVVADQIGTPTSARFIAKATCDVLSQYKKNSVGYFDGRSGICNLVCEGEVSWHGFAEEIFRQASLMGFKIAVNKIAPIATSDWPTPATRPLNSRLSTAMLKATFGISPPTWQNELTLILQDLKSLA